MKILPVLDLKEGVVVRGVAGRRDEYRPIVSRLCDEASPRAVADGLRNTFGFQECYVADLDAIGGRPPNRAAFQAVVAAGLRPWIDAGTAAVDLPAATVVVGLESLADPAALQRSLAAVGAARFTFSLDLKHGRPLTESPAWHGLDPLDIAARAVDRGVQSMIVLDLAAVGVGQGVPTLDLCRTLRKNYPQLELITGGGVRDAADLHAVRDVGCNAVLIASALHDGRLTPDVLQTFLES